MSRRLTTQDLINECRSLIDEDNIENVSDVDDILPSLNRAKDYALSIVSRRDESQLLKTVDIPSEDISSEIDVPKKAFEGRLEKVEVNINGTYTPIQRIDFHDISLYESPSTSSIPLYYCIVGNKFRLVPTPSATYPLRLWYLQDETLVLPLGTITQANEATAFILVDEIGEGLGTSVSGYESYFNVIDGFTGEIKGTFQALTLSGNRISVKETPTRSTVLGRTVSGSADLASIAEVDDFICSIHGTCIPPLKKPLSNFLIQYAALELSGKLDGNVENLLPMFTRLENQVEKNWVGREQRRRVKRVSKNWSLLRRRNPYV